MQSDLSTNSSPLSGRLPYSPWRNEERLRNQMDHALQEARARMTQPPTEQSEIPSWQEDGVLTAFQSVEAWAPPSSRQDAAPDSLGVHQTQGLSSQIGNYTQFFGTVNAVVDMDRITQAFLSQKVVPEWSYTLIRFSRLKQSPVTRDIRRC